MESNYGVGINNRYALFLDEEGEENEEALITKTAAKVEQVKAQSAKPATNAGQTSKEIALNKAKEAAAEKAKLAAKNQAKGGKGDKREGKDKMEISCTGTSPDFYWSYMMILLKWRAK